MGPEEKVVAELDLSSQEYLESLIRMLDTPVNRRRLNVIENLCVRKIQEALSAGKTLK